MQHIFTHTKTSKRHLDFRHQISSLCYLALTLANLSELSRETRSLKLHMNLPICK